MALQKLSIEIEYTGGALGFDMKSPDDDAWLDIDDNFICRMSQVNGLIEALIDARDRFNSVYAPTPQDATE